jgi:hypothetical protein
MSTFGPSDDVAELLEHERRAVQVDLQHRLGRRLRRRDSSRVDQPGDVPEACGLLDERMNGLAVGRVDRRNADVVARVAEGLGRGVGVLLAHVSQQNVLADADAPRDGLADQAGSDDDDHLAHADSLVV